MNIDKLYRITQKFWLKIICRLQENKKRMRMKSLNSPEADK